MIGGKSVLAIVPARGGSKGVKRKNVRLVGGKPLIAWTIESAFASKYIDRVVLSSEDDEIISVSRQFGCDVPVRRPVELAQDDTPGIAPVLHMMTCVPSFDIIILLQPTSPLRSTHDIDAGLEFFESKGTCSVVSVTESDKSPNWMYWLTDDDKMTHITESDTGTRRQDLRKAFVLNGALYIAKSTWLEQNKTFLTDDTLAFIMSKDHSLDIDTELDLEIADFLMSKRQHL